MRVNRREALTLGALGTLGAFGLSVPTGRGVQADTISRLAPQNMPKPYATPFFRPPVLRGDKRKDAKGLFTCYEVTEKAGTAEIVPGLTTPVYGYNGSVPGPIIKVEQDERVKLRVRNQLPGKHPMFGHAFNTSTHLHGSASLPQYDGYADDVNHPGDFKEYWYPNWQSARTLWYHDHNVHTTAQNAYSGLAAQYHLSDAAERDLLPQGHYDVPLTITDAMFAANGSLAYDDNSHSGLWGDVILVNGKPWPVMPVRRAIYRFRILNACIARSLRLHLSNGQPLVVVATDGGLVPVAQPVAQLRQAGAERYEVLIDFSKLAVGATVDLLNRSNDNNEDYDNTDKIMRFQVADFTPDDRPGEYASKTISAMPNLLVRSEAMSLKASQSTGSYYMRLERGNSEFQINDTGWHDVVRSGYKKVLTTVKPDAVQIWTVENKSGGWFHPLHIHLVDFQILSRNGRAPQAYERGPKDTVYVGENETVKLLMKFTLQKGGGTSQNAGGRYMVHCHNLPHEDHDMMAQFAVGDPKVNDPILSAPCKKDEGVYDDGKDVPGA